MPHAGGHSPRTLYGGGIRGKIFSVWSRPAKTTTVPCACVHLDGDEDGETAVLQRVRLCKARCWHLLDRPTASHAALAVTPSCPRPAPHLPMAHDTEWLIAHGSLRLRQTVVAADGLGLGLFRGFGQLHHTAMHAAGCSAVRSHTCLLRPPGGALVRTGVTFTRNFVGGGVYFTVS